MDQGGVGTGQAGTPKLNWVRERTRIGAAARQLGLECECQPSPDPSICSSLTDRWFEVVDAIANDRGISRQAAVLILSGLFDDYMAAIERLKGPGPA